MINFDKIELTIDSPRVLSAPDLLPYHIDYIIVSDNREWILVLRRCLETDKPAKKLKYAELVNYLKKKTIFQRNENVGEILEKLRKNLEY